MWHHHSLYFILVMHVMTALLVIGVVLLQIVAIIIDRYEALPSVIVHGLLRGVHAVFFISMASLFLTGSYWVVHSGMGFHSAWLLVAYVLSGVVALCWWVMMKYSSRWSRGVLVVMHVGLLLLLFFIVRDAVTQSTWFWG